MRYVRIEVPAQETVMVAAKMRRSKIGCVGRASSMARLHNRGVICSPEVHSPLVVPIGYLRELIVSLPRLSDLIFAYVILFG